MKPLEGIIVLDFAQYLAGPSAALRLADLGARVIKIERPQGGDNGRRLVFKNLISDNDGVLFHTINRNKESFCADLKNLDDLKIIKELIKKADIIIENFRPGIMEKLGLGYEDVKKINPKLIYATVSGYGLDGPWVKRPGQDLMLQSLSGLTLLNGSRDDLPTPVALAMADTYAGIHLVQGILSCLYSRFKTGVGARVAVSLLESILDLQFEFIATYINDNYTLPVRAKFNNAHVYLPAPYGIYQTKDNFLALAMGSVPLLGEILELSELSKYDNPASCFANRDEIKELIQSKLIQDSTENWLTKLKEVNYWASEVLNWKELIDRPGFKSLDMLINVGRPGHRDIITTRCPIRVDGEVYKSNKWAPALGEDTSKIMKEFNLCSQPIESSSKLAVESSSENNLVLPLAGVKVLDLCQFLAGPSAALRLADLGAEVLKVEQPSGDICRTLYSSNLIIDGDSTLFHVINRNKDAVSIDLKSDVGQLQIQKLVKNADVVLINFRPHVAKKLGIDYDSLKVINPSLVYGELTGFGHVGEWANEPGQDLLVQSISGMTMANGNRDKLPTPAGVSIADLISGQHLVQGVLAALHRKELFGKGALVQISMLESMMDLQFEGFTTFLNDGNEIPQRSKISNANFYTNAPYGIYKTKDWFITLAIAPIPLLGQLLNCPKLEEYSDPVTWSTKRDEIKAILADHLLTNNTQFWLDILQQHDIWCSNIYNWDMLLETDAFKNLEMLQEIKLQSGKTMTVLRCPISINGQRFYSDKPSPKIGQDNHKYLN